MGTLFQQVSTGTQSLDYTEIVELVVKTRSESCRAHKLRVQIKSDSYANQSYARIEKYDGTLWQALHSIPWSVMGTQSKLCYMPKDMMPDDQRELFLTDRNELLRVAELILN
jgi:hypothetical protein